MQAIRQILVPTDFSETSKQAVDDALDLAQKFDASVTLIHVEQLPIFPYAEPMFVYGTQIEKEIRDRAQAEMDKLAKDCEARLGRSVGKKIAIGSPPNEIVEEAKIGKYDLIVIATHGRTGITHLLIGSTAERVVQLAPCRVLTVRGATKA